MWANVAKGFLLAVGVDFAICKTKEEQTESYAETAVKWAYHKVKDFREAKKEEKEDDKKKSTSKSSSKKK